MERLLDKNTQPTIEDIIAFMGKESYQCLLQFEEQLRQHYDVVKNLKFPFGNSYGWGYQFLHKKTHLCYAFFEKGTFTVMIQLGDAHVEEVECMLVNGSDKACTLWKNRYPCGKVGGWIHYQVTSVTELQEVLNFVYIKKKPKLSIK